MSRAVHFLYPADEKAMTFGGDNDTEAKCLARIGLMRANFGDTHTSVTTSSEWWPMILCPIGKSSGAYSWHYKEWKPVYCEEELVALLLR